MRVSLIVIAALMSSSCSLPVMFSVNVDEPIVGGTLTLNGGNASLMKNVDGAYWAKWGGSDASGQIAVVFPDGARAVCKVGYVTNNMTDIQRFSVKDRKCEQVLSN